MTAPARYRYILTLHQAAIEDIFQKAMRAMGVEVERSVVPTSLDIVEEKMSNPEAHAVKVRGLHESPVLWFNVAHRNIVVQVYLASPGSLDAVPNEVVNARFVIGTDGR